MSRIKEILQTKSILTPGRQPGGGFQSLPLGLLAGGTPAPFTVYLKIRPRGQPRPLYFQCCPKGEVFPRRWQVQMQELKISRVYIRREERAQALPLVRQKFQEILTARARGNREKARWGYETALLWLQHLFTLDREHLSEELEIGFNLIENLYEIIMEEKDPGGLALDLWRQEGLPAHGLHSCLLGLGFARYLGWQEKDAKALGFTALVHDVGMTEVPRSILEKPNPLTSTEKGVIQNHPQAGCTILWHSSLCRWQSLLTVMQHHENCDGSGYPERLKLRQIHPWARILRILDSFEAMVSTRHWRAARPPKEALWSLRRDWEKNRVYDPDYLSLFIKFLAGSRILGT
ncbi:MAG: HD-GYP domain-containing protein [Thermodesulfobacteriota bacterium]